MGTEVNTNSPLLLDSLRLGPVRVLRFERELSALDGPVLRIMNDATNGTEDRGECHRIQKKKDRYQTIELPHTMPPRCDFRSPYGSGVPHI